VNYFVFVVVDGHPIWWRTTRCLARAPVGSNKNLSNSTGINTDDTNNPDNGTYTVTKMDNDILPHHYNKIKKDRKRKYVSFY
jgi:hypothetical protein